MNYRAAASINLVIAATTDVHGNLGGGLKSSEPVSKEGGLARVATAVQKLRDSEKNVLLLDNGDFLQGAAVCDLAAEGLLPDQSIHPVIQAMNALEYDAVGLGNHEFDYGIPTLSQALSGARFPVLSSNTEMPDAPWGRDLLLDIRASDEAGQFHDLKIGIISLLPPMLEDWNHSIVAGKIKVSGFKDIAEQHVENLKRDGADLVIALCHAGRRPHGVGGNAEVLATELDGITDMDVIICGHTHEVWPPVEEVVSFSHQSSHSAISKPNVQAGACAEHLGVIKINLKKSANRWRWIQGKAMTLPLDQKVQEQPALSKLMSTAIEGAKTTLDQVIGKTHFPIHSHFAKIMCDPVTRLAATAKYQIAQSIFQENPEFDLPILVAASPLKGGHEGAHGFTEILPGPIQRRDLYEMYPYMNTVEALVLTGKEIKDWLETSASAFSTVAPGGELQPLWNSRFPLYEFDSILGITYEIDLTQSPRISADRTKIDPASKRIRNLKINGNDLDSNSQVVLITNGYRAGGGGAFPHAKEAQRLDMSFHKVRPMLQKLLAEELTEDTLLPPSWSFTKIPNTSAFFETCGRATGHIPPEIASKIAPLDNSADCFTSFRLALG